MLVWIQIFSNLTARFLIAMLKFQAEIEADFFGLTQLLIFLIEKSYLTHISSIYIGLYMLYYDFV